MIGKMKNIAFTKIGQNEIYLNTQKLLQNSIKVGDGTTTPIFEDNMEKDENEEAAPWERNCDLGEITWRNHHSKEENYIHVEGDPNEPEILKVIKEPLDEGIHEGITEIEEDIENQKTEDLIMNNNAENDKNMGNEEDEITRAPEK